MFLSQDPANSLIWGIPAIVFSGVLSGAIGATIALIATWRQNAAHAKRLEEQLRHDAQQRREEREMALRREVYLSAAESIAKMQVYFSRLADTTITAKEQSAGMENIWDALNKVAIVGSPETIDALIKIQIYFTKSQSILIMEGLKHRSLVLEQEQIDSSLKQQENLHEQLVEEINLAKKKNDSQEAERLLTQFNAVSSKISQLKLRESQINKRIIESSFEIQILNSKINVDFEQLAAHGNVCIRKELNLPIDEKRYLELIREGTEENHKYVKELIGIFKSEYSGFFKV